MSPKIIPMCTILHVCNMIHVIVLPGVIMHQKYEHIGPGTFAVTQVTVVHLITMLLQCTNYHILFLYSLHWFLAAGNLICAIYTIIFIKLWSYAQVNYWCRIALKSKAAGGATYDGNRQFNRNNSLIELSQNPPARKHNQYI